MYFAEKLDSLKPDCREKELQMDYISYYHLGI